MKAFVCDDDYKPLVPDGKYEAQCVNYDNKFCLGKTRKTFLNFVILEQGEHYGKRLFMAFNMPYNGRIKTGSKFYKTWVMVNNWQRPSRNARMSPKLFLNKIFTVKTRTVTPKYNERSMPDSFKYSIVDSILSVFSG